MPYACYDTTSGDFVSADAGTSVLANVLQPFNDPTGHVCFNPQIRWSFLGLLLALQSLLLIWFGMILRIAYGVISNKGAQDLRSDEEEEEDIEEIEYTELDEKSEEQSLWPIEVEVTGDEITGIFSTNRAGSPAARTRGQKRNAAARASAISIPGRGDHKELLGRIGCDKPT